MVKFQSALHEQQKQVVLVRGGRGIYVKRGKGNMSPEAEANRQLHAALFGDAPAQDVVRYRSRRVPSVHPPSPRLVGIEPNPGPKMPGLAAAVTGAVRAATQAANLASSVAKAVAPAKKKKKSKRNRVAPGSLTSKFSDSSINRRATAAPPPIRDIGGTSNFRDHITVTFDNTSMPLYVSSGATSPFYFGTGGTSNWGFGLDPNQTYGGYSPFGKAIANLSNSYRMWRIVSLRARFESARPTTESGVTIIAYTPDGGVDVTVSPTGPDTVASNKGSILVQTGQSTDIPVYDLNKDWLYVSDASAGGAANNRQAHAGAFINYAVNVASGTGILLGYMRLSGTIQFAGLGSTSGMVPASSSSSSSTAPAATSVVPETYVLVPAPKV